MGAGQGSSWDDFVCCSRGIRRARCVYVERDGGVVHSPGLHCLFKIAESLKRPTLCRPWNNRYNHHVSASRLF